MGTTLLLMLGADSQHSGQLRELLLVACFQQPQHTAIDRGTIIVNLFGGGSSYGSALISRQSRAQRSVIGVEQIIVRLIARITCRIPIAAPYRAW